MEHRQEPAGLSLQTMEKVIGDKLWRSRLSAQLLAAFAAIALLLAGVGIYGVISCVVRRRTQEIGIRLALGATRAAVVRLVLKESMKPVAMGIALGLAMALAATRLATTMLYGVTPTDPATYLGMTVCLSATAVLATLIPAWRALQADPVSTLRQE